MARARRGRQRAGARELVILTFDDDRFFGAVFPATECTGLVSQGLTRDSRVYQPRTTQPRCECFGSKKREYSEVHVTTGAE